MGLQIQDPLTKCAKLAIQSSISIPLGGRLVGFSLWVCFSVPTSPFNRFTVLTKSSAPLWAFKSKIRSQNVRKWPFKQVFKFRWEQGLLDFTCGCILQCEPAH